MSRSAGFRAPDSPWPWALVPWLNFRSRCDPPLMVSDAARTTLAPYGDPHEANSAHCMP